MKEKNQRWRRIRGKGKEKSRITRKLKKKKKRTKKRNEELEENGRDSEEMWRSKKYVYNDEK